jgi:quinolinate synthase
LKMEKKNEQALHVVYINTPLETKAVSTSVVVPTITCTSSNVLQTMLQASAQVGPDLKILYGPDTYMGENLQTLFDSILAKTDGSMKRFDGNCILPTIAKPCNNSDRN